MRRVLRRIFDNSSSVAAGKAADTMALGLLGDIRIGVEFMPWTRAAMRPSTVVHVLNEIMINDRKSIIEFGAGVSTLYFAWAAKKTRSKFLSIEENEDWCKKIKSLLSDNDLSGHCDIHFVPRQHTDMEGYSSRWYDADRVRELVDGRMFDLVVVDGPTAFRKGEENARRPAIDILEPCLADRCAIFLDDALRVGEGQILTAWEETLGEKAMIETIAGGHAYIGRGQRYFSGL